MPVNKIPDAEFDVMEAVWRMDPPIHPAELLSALGKEWKPQTLFSLLSRLVDRGFLRTEKQGRERVFYPVVRREDYVKAETDSFLKRYHRGSFASLVSTLYGDKPISQEEAESLSKWLEEWK